MRYWVYQDARVQGPFSKEDLASVAGLDQDSLVCPADASGGAKESDWTAMSEHSELADLFVVGSGVSYAPAAEATASDFFQFRKESQEILDRIGYPDAWISGVFEDPTMFDVHAGLAGVIGGEIAPHPDKGRTAELESRLCELQDQIQDYEKRTNEILDVLGEKDKAIEELKSRLQNFEKERVEAAAKIAAADIVLPVEPAGSGEGAQNSGSADSEFSDQSEGRASVQAEEAAAFVESETADISAPPAEDFVAPAVGEAVVAQSPEALKSTSAMPEGEEFVPPMPDDADPASEPPPLEPPPLEPVPADSGQDAFLAPPSFEQPKTMVFGQPGTPVPSGITPPLTAPSMAPPPLIPGEPAPAQIPAAMAGGPVPTEMPGSGAGLEEFAPPALPGQSPTPMPIPLGGVLTPMPGMGQPDIPQTVLQGMGVGAATTPIPGFGTTPASQSFEELMGKPATATPQLTPSSPELAKTGIIQPLAGGAPTETGSGGESKFKKFQSKKFLIGLGLAGVVLIVLLLLFFQNPKQVQQMVEMSPEQAPVGEGNQEEPTDPFQGGVQGAQADLPGSRNPQDLSPQNTGGGFGSTPRGGGFPPPQESAASSGGFDFIQDEQIQAMEFVKNYVLSGAKGTIDGWLSYSFPPPNMPQWSAGGVSKDVWLVEYLVFKGPKSKNPDTTYSFEVNLRNQSLKARNAATKSLLAGSEELNKQVKFDPPSKEPQALP